MDRTEQLLEALASKRPGITIHMNGSGVIITPNYLAGISAQRTSIFDAAFSLSRMILDAVAKEPSLKKSLAPVLAKLKKYDNLITL